MNLSFLLELAEFEIYLLKGLLLQEPIDLEFVMTHANALADQANEPAFTETVTAFGEHAARCGADASDMVTLTNACGMTREAIKARPIPTAGPFVPVNGC